MRKSAQISVLIATLLGMSPGVSLAQQASTVQTPTFRSQSELVQIPVLVRRSGKHLAGLNAGDFTVLEDGVIQRIARFEEVSTPDQPAQWQEPAMGTFTNDLWQANGPGRVTILVFDLLNTPFVKQTYLRDSLMRFLDALPARHDPIMLAAFTAKGLKIVHFFTTDPAVLRAAVAKMKSHMSEVERSSELARSKEEATQAAISVVESQNGGHAEADDPEVKRLKELFQTVSDQHVQRLDLHRTELTLLMMQQLAQSLSGIPGRKSMVWATGGIAYTRGSDSVESPTPGPHKTEGLADTQIAEGNDLFDSTWRKLAMRISLFMSSISKS
jgi:VWFA-related protein